MVTRWLLSAITAISGSSWLRCACPGAASPTSAEADGHKAEHRLEHDCAETDLL